MKNRKINLTLPSITKKELKAAESVLKSGWLIRGMQTKLFEEEFAKFMGGKFAVATNGCTMALYLVVEGMRLKKEDEVIVPSLTWSATASIVIQAGATPVFADVRKEDWCLDPKDVKRKISSRTKLIIPVHYGARYAEGFENLEVPVLFDSAHRIERNDFGGTTSCYSFYAVKNMTTIRGGMILTNDEDKAAWYRMACHGGIAKDTLSRYQGVSKNDASSFYYEIEEPGWNFDMTDVEAAIGREQLKRVEEFNQKREKIVSEYNSAFGLKNTGNHLYPILVKNRDEFLVNMKNAGIQCSIHYLPLHLMKGYREFYKTSLPVTEFIGEHCVSVPLYPDLTENEIARIIEHVKKLGQIIRSI